MKYLTFRVILLIFCGLFSVLGISPKAVASESTSVTGQAEVQNTGGDLDFSGSNSNVVLGSENTFSGYVWSEDLGWIDFSGVTFDPTSKAVSGKATVQNTGNFIDFNTNSNNSNVTITGNLFSGYGWSEDIGWINFSGVLVGLSVLPQTGADL